MDHPDEPGDDDEQGNRASVRSVIEEGGLQMSERQQTIQTMIRVWDAMRGNGCEICANIR